MRGREEIVAIVAAHKELTGEVVQAARLMAAAGYGAFAAHLDQHRAELNVAIGEFAVWAESFGDWAKVDASWATYPPATTDLPGEPPTLELENDLRRARDALLARRTAVLATLGGAREALAWLISRAGFAAAGRWHTGVVSCVSVVRYPGAPARIAPTAGNWWSLWNPVCCCRWTC